MAVSSGVLVALLLSGLGLHSSKAASCSAVQNACIADTNTCGPIQVDYLAKCATAFESPGSCSDQCKDTYDSLLGNAIGRGYYHCDCGSDETDEYTAVCRRYTKNLLDHCYDGVQPSPPPANVTGTNPVPLTRLSCSSVQVACYGSSRCRPRLLDYGQHCAFALRGINCSQQCNESFIRLLQDQVGFTFQGCDCENDTMCAAGGLNLLRTCYNYSFPVVRPQPYQSVYPAGSCESFQEKCFIDNYFACGIHFSQLQAPCQSASTLSCSSSCLAALQNVVKSVSFMTDLTTCTCNNASSSMCNGITSYRTVFTSCGVPLPTVHVPDTVATSMVPTTGSATSMVPTTGSATSVGARVLIVLFMIIGPYMLIA